MNRYDGMTILVDEKVSVIVSSSVSVSVGSGSFSLCSSSSSLLVTPTSTFTYVHRYICIYIYTKSNSQYISLTSPSPCLSSDLYRSHPPQKASSHMIISPTGKRIPTPILHLNTHTHIHIHTERESARLLIRLALPAKDGIMPFLCVVLCGLIVELGVDSMRKCKIQI